MLSKLLRFNVVMGLGAAAVVLWLISWPLVMTSWAGRMWRQVPCHADDRGAFYYHIDGVKYFSTRRDFWQTSYVCEKAPTDSGDLPDNGTCAVSPHDALASVMYLDAWTNWSNSLGRIVPGVLILAVTGGLLAAGKKRP